MKQQAALVGAVVMVVCIAWNVSRQRWLEAGACAMALYFNLSIATRRSN